MLKLDQIEEGTYTVSIIREGYNEYKGTWTVKADGTNNFTANLEAPKVALSANAVSADLEAEANITKNFTIKNEGNGT